MTESAASRAVSDADQLVQLLSDQQRGYEQLAALGGQYRELLNEGQTDTLRALIDQRQQIVERLVSLHGQWQARQAAAAKLGEADRLRLEKIIRRITELRESVLADQDRDLKRLHEARGRLREQLEQIRTAGTAMMAYRPAPAGCSSRLTDRQG